jgi:hypothetical protein
VTFTVERYTGVMVDATRALVGVLRTGHIRALARDDVEIEIVIGPGHVTPP